MRGERWRGRKANARLGARPRVRNGNDSGPLCFSFVFKLFKS